MRSSSSWDWPGRPRRGSARCRAVRARRVDVALGIIGRPELLFLDEPTTGFDPQARRQFGDLIRQLAADGVTILLTTHYLEEAAALAGRLAVLAAGRVVAIGEPGAIGGADRPARIGWDTPDGRRSMETATPARAVCDLARRMDGEIPGLTVTRPTLEDTYLELIGGLSWTASAPVRREPAPPSSPPPSSSRPSSALPVRAAHRPGQGPGRAEDVLPRAGDGRLHLRAAGHPARAARVDLRRPGRRGRRDRRAALRGRHDRRRHRVHQLPVPRDSHHGRARPGIAQAALLGPRCCTRRTSSARSFRSWCA